MDVSSGNILLDNNYYLKGNRGDGSISSLIGIDNGQNIVIGESTSVPSSLKIMTPVDAGQGVGIYNGTTDIAWFENNGNVGIGTTTPNYNLEIQNTADAAIFLEADTDNSNETDNAFLKLSQDNGAVTAILGTVGNAGYDPENNSYTNTVANATLLGSINPYSLQFGTNDAVRLTINSSGNVGIGTTNPASLLEIEGSNNAALSISNTSAGSISSPVESKLQFRGYGNNVRAEIAGLDKASSLSGGWLTFKTQDSSSTLQDRMIIDRDGNVGIGTTSPAAELDINGGLYLTDTTRTYFDGVRTFENVAHYYNGNTTHTGTIVITIGNTPNMMIDGEISVQGYNKLTKYHFRGYTYTASSNWHQPQASCTTSNGDCTVRFGKLSSNDDRVILLGTTSTDWGSYPHIAVTRVTKGYGSGDNIGDWSISIVTDESPYTIGTTPNVNTGFTAYNPIFTGNVGIGTTSPSAPLSFANSTGAKINLYSTTYAIGVESSELRIASNDKITFFTDGYSSGEKMRISNNGNVGIGTTSPSQTLDVNGTITATDITCSDCLNQGDIANNAIGQGELKTTTGEVSANALGSITLPGGTYGFFPQSKRDSSCSSVEVELARKTASAGTGTSYATTVVVTGINSCTVYFQQRYVQASPPYYIDGYLIPHFIYILRDKNTNKMLASYQAQDPPWDNNGGSPQKMPHPFFDYIDKELPSNLEIDLIDTSDIVELKQKAADKGISLLEYIQNYMDVDTQNYTPPTSPETHRPIQLPDQVTWRKLKDKPSDEIQLNKAVADNSVVKQQGADIAESYPASFLEAGDIVDVMKAHEAKPWDNKPNYTLVKSRTEYSGKALGIVSTNPAQIIGNNQDRNRVPLALAGRVPVKVILSGPKISVGDPITSSVIPGFGVKSQHPGHIVAKALESTKDIDISKCSTVESLTSIEWPDDDGSNQNKVCFKVPKDSLSQDIKANLSLKYLINDKYIIVGKIMSFVNLSWYDPTVKVSGKGILIDRRTGKAIYNSVQTSSLETNKLTAQISNLTEIISQKVTTAALKAKDISTTTFSAATAKIQTLNVDKVMVSGKNLANYINELIDKKLEQNQKTISPVVEVKDITATGSANLAHIQTKEISPQEKDLVLSLRAKRDNLGGKLSKLIIKGLNNKNVVTIDSVGNATFSGTLAAKQVNADKAKIAQINTDKLSGKEASLSGKLIAKEVEAENIKKIENSVSQTKSNIQQLQDAYSNEKAATTETQKSIETLNNDVNEIQKLLADIQNDSSTNPQYYQNIDDNSNVASDGIQQNTTLENLVVTGNSNLYALSVADSFSVGTISMRDNSIIALASKLELSALNEVSFFGGSVVIARNGNITTSGTLIAKGGIKTNKIESISPEDNITVKLNSKPQNPNNKQITNNKLQITNQLDKEVASINASGSAKFKDIALNKYMDATSSAAIIAADENFNKHGLYLPAIETGNTSAGVGRLPQKKGEVVIYNDNVNKDSLIYLTPTTYGFSGRLTVLQKENGYFAVAVNQISNVDIIFDWLIVN